MMLDEAGILFVEGKEGDLDIGHPYWPRGHSGVTLPGGYDLGQVAGYQFAADWVTRMDQQFSRRLAACCGVKGAAAGALASDPTIRSIPIPRGMAEPVFRTIVLPRYCADAEATYPGLETMPAEVQTAIVSLEFNRGGIPRAFNAESSDASRYQEESIIRDAVRDGNVLMVAEAFEAMGREVDNALWPGNNPPNPGLRRRRRQETALIRGWLATKVAA